jgi:hypothetical protein
LQFGVPISSLSVSTNATGQSQQSLTFGLSPLTVPEPASIVMTVVPMLAFYMFRRRRFVTRN